jgi:methylglyoxal synthase
VFTGGTFGSLQSPVTSLPEYKGRLHSLARSALGVIQVANLVVYGHVFGVAFFNHVEDLYADSPQNLCLRRICNYMRTPLFEDATSIEYILRLWEGGHRRTERKPTDYPKQAIDAYYGTGPFEDSVLSQEDLPVIRRQAQLPSRETLAIVSHDMQKMTMLNFCLEHLSRILTYRRVISTGTTGTFLRRQMQVALENFTFSRALKSRWGWDDRTQSASEFLARKIQPLASGPKGGDVQISAKVIDGTCHRILFFQDPESAHPHQFDIRLMEKAVQDPKTGALFATSDRTARLIL